MSETFYYIYSLLSQPYAVLLLAFILDLFIGDPAWLPHPVQAMGWTIAKTERALRHLIKDMANNKLAEKASGILLVAAITTSTYGISYICASALSASYNSPIAALISYIALVCLVSSTIAVKGLTDSVYDVVSALRADNINAARFSLSRIVGRDTRSLDNKSIFRAAIESLAENASDGIIAPLFYFAIGGLPLAMTYKAINTMDSMVGYKNEKYRHFGWAAARLDDIANYIPARITGFLIAVASSVLSLSFAACYSSLKIMLRDSRKHPSPNSGVPEAAMAGALNITLGGPSTYNGIRIDKPFIGEGTVGDYLSASEKGINIIWVVSLLGFSIAAGLLFMRSIR